VFNSAAVLNMVFLYNPG